MNELSGAEGDGLMSTAELEELVDNDWPQVDKLECSICVEPISENQGEQSSGAKFVTPCNHMFHRGCIERWLTANANNASCPNCREPMERPDVTIDTSNFAQILSDWQGSLTIKTKTRWWETYGHDRVIEFSEGTPYEVKYALESVLREVWRPAHLSMLPHGDRFLESMPLETIQEKLAEKTGWNVEYSKKTEFPDDDDYPSSIEGMSDEEEEFDDDDDRWVETEEFVLSVEDDGLWLPNVFQNGSEE